MSKQQDTEKQIVNELANHFWEEDKYVTGSSFEYTKAEAQKMLDQQKAEAVRQYAERLKTLLNPNVPGYSLSAEDINQTLKEFLGEER
jgi:hypothetical protein